MPVADDVDLAAIAGRTEGFVGSDLAALCREAGLTALRENVRASKVTKAHFEAALHKIRPVPTPNRSAPTRSMRSA